MCCHCEPPGKYLFEVFLEWGLLQANKKWQGLTHRYIDVVEYENCSVWMTNGCGNMKRVKLARAVEKDSTEEAMLRLNVEGWGRAKWVEQCEDKIPSQGTGMMDVKARGGLFCSWLEAQARLSPWESSLPLDALPTTTVGLWANHCAYRDPIFI